MAIRTLAENYAPIEGLYVNAEYRERPDYRFVHDRKPHHHRELAATMPPTEPHFAYRHWTIQDMFDSAYVNRMLHRARDYGMNGIQFSGDNNYWVNDSLHRYNTYVNIGELCERCHRLGLKAYFHVLLPVLRYRLAVRLRVLGRESLPVIRENPLP